MVLRDAGGSQVSTAVRSQLDSAGAAGKTPTARPSSWPKRCSRFRSSEPATRSSSCRAFAEGTHGAAIAPRECRWDRPATISTLRSRGPVVPSASGRCPAHCGGSRVRVRSGHPRCRLRPVRRGEPRQPPTIRLRGSCLTSSSAACRPCHRCSCRRAGICARLPPMCKCHSGGTARVRPVSGALRRDYVGQMSSRDFGASPRRERVANGRLSQHRQCRIGSGGVHSAARTAA